MQTTQRRDQVAPVRLHQTETQFVLAVPLPGLEPDDISVSVDGQELRIQGESRGPATSVRDVLLSEWSPGPYERRLTLPVPVNAGGINASYGNGVLVLSIPKATDGHVATLASFRLQPVEATRGVWVGRPPGDPRSA